MKSNEYKYSAFISYRHVDVKIAQKLHKALENYRIPKDIAKKYGATKIGKVFRDIDELPASSDLGNDIEEALRNSEYLIVICSKETPKSIWVHEEIKKFIQFHGYRKILTLLVDGEPEESFPEELLFETTDHGIQMMEPLAADIRPVNGKRRSKDFRVGMLKLMAPIIGCTFDDLKQRAKEQKFRRLLLMVSSVALLAVAVSTFYLYQNQKILNANSIIKEQSQKLIDQNQKLAEQIEETERQKNLAIENEGIAQDYAKEAQLQQSLAEANAATALENEQLAKENEKIALERLAEIERQKGEINEQNTLLSNQILENNEYLCGSYLDNAQNLIAEKRFDEGAQKVLEASALLNSQMPQYSILKARMDGLAFITSLKMIESPYKVTDVHSQLSDLCIVPGNKSFVTVSHDDKITHWDMATSSAIESVICQVGNPELVNISPNGKYLVVVTDDYQAVCYAFPELTYLYSVDGIYCRSIIFTQDSENFIVGVDMIQTETGQLTKTFMNSQYVSDTYMTLDEKKLLGIDSDAGIHIWDINDPEHEDIVLLSEQGYMVTTFVDILKVMFIPNQNVCVFLLRDGSAFLLDLQQGKVLCRLSSDQKYIQVCYDQAQDLMVLISETTAVYYSPISFDVVDEVEIGNYKYIETDDSGSALIGQTNSDFTVSRLGNNSTDRTYQFSGDTFSTESLSSKLSHIQLLEDGTALLIFYDKVVHLFEIADYKYEWYAYTDDFSQDALLDPSGKYIFIHLRYQGDSILVYDRMTGKQLHSFKLTDTYNFGDYRYVEDRNEIQVILNNGVVISYNIDTALRQEMTIPIKSQYVESIRFLGSSDQVIIEYFTYDVDVWNIVDNELVETLVEPKDNINEVAIDGEKCYLLGNQYLYEYDSSTNNTTQHTLPQVNVSYRMVYWSKMDTLAISNDQRFVAVGSSYQAQGILVYDLQTNQVVHVFNDAEDSISKLEFSDDGKYLIGYDDAYQMLVWRLEDGVLLHRIQTTKFLECEGFTMTPDGTAVIVNYFLEYSEIYDLSTGTKMCTLDYGYVNSISQSESRYLISVGLNETWLFEMYDMASYIDILRTIVQKSQGGS